MAVAIVGTIGAAVQSASAGAESAPAWGTSQNRVAGNLLVCWCSVTAVATLPTTPANWSIAKQTAGTSCSATIYYKVATGADAAPTFTVTSGWVAAQLCEFSGLAGTSPLDTYQGTATGTTSPVTATWGGVDTAAGELYLACGGDYRGTARASNDTWTSNRTTLVPAGNNNGTSSRYHYSNVYIAGTDSKANADTAIMTLSITSNITGLVVVGATFKLKPAPAVTSLDVVTGSTAGGTTVVITGTSFYGASAVTIGGHNATSFNVLSDTSISMVTAAHAAEANLQVQVTTPAGASADVAGDNFSYVTPVTLSAASTLTAFTAASASLSHTPPPATTLSAASTLTAFTAGSASLTNTPPPTTLSAASTLTAFTAGDASIEWSAAVTPTTLSAASTLTAFTAASASLTHYQYTTTLTAAASLTAFTAGAASLAHTPATPTTLAAASTLTGFTAGSASIAWSPATPTTLSAASTLTGFTAGAASLTNTPPPTSLTAASTLTAFTAGAASLTHAPATPTTLSAASTLTAFTAGTASLSHTPATPTTFAAASTLTAFVAASADIIHGVVTTTVSAASTLTAALAGAASLENTPPTAVTFTGASTLTGYVSASADLDNVPPAAVTMTAASTLTATVSASADIGGGVPVLVTAASTLTGKVSGVSYIVVGVTGPIRWPAPRAWPHAAAPRSHPGQAVPTASAKWHRDHER